MKNKHKNIFIIFTLSLFVFAITGCDKQTTAKERLYHEYFPVHIGHCVIYDVDSIVYDDFTGNIDTFYYQVKEVFHSKFIDNSGNESIRLERYFRSNPEQSWKVNNVWSAKLIPFRAEKVEENIRYIKLVFPPKINKRWDGNAYNSKPEQIYRITEAHEQKVINNFNFDSVVTVLQKDFQTEISTEYQVEKFAKNIGMVYKKYVDFSLGVDGNFYGVDYSYKIVDYCIKD